MERKGGSSTDVMTVEEVKARLLRDRSLGAEEERVLRMRHGVTQELTVPLPRAAGKNAELADELLLMEMQLMRAHRERMKATRAPARAVALSPTKAKIVRALRKKK